MEEDKKRSGGKRWFFLGLFSGILACLILATALLRSGSITLLSSGETKDSAVNAESIAKLENLEQAISKHYYQADEVTQEQKEDGLYKGLLESLDDPYSVYYTKEEVAKLNDMLSGTYGGIGAYISLDETYNIAKIAGVIKDSPAEKAGLKADDLIYKVDGKLTDGMSLDDVVSLVKGEEGTTVNLTIARKGEDDYLEIKVKREIIDAPTVDTKVLDNDIGYIEVAGFESVTADQFREGLSDLQSKNIRGLIIDLRNNPGGDVDVCVDMARQILPKGLVFYMVDSSGKKTEYKCDGKNKLKIPLAVLVNGNSASASEIFSGAVQDSKIGTLVGTQTFGKGIVQTVYSLTDGTAVKITTANYYTRGGHNINKVGITPDIEVKLDADAYQKDGTDTQLEKALEVVSTKRK